MQIKELTKEELGSLIAGIHQLSKDRLRDLVLQIWKMAEHHEENADKHHAGVRTLEHLGYTYHDGQLWKPPLGKKPDFDLMATWRERVVSLESQRMKLESVNKSLSDRLFCTMEIEKCNDKIVTELRRRLQQPIKLPNKNDDEFWFDGVFQVAKFDRAIERAIIAAGLKVEGVS